MRIKQRPVSGWQVRKRPRGDHSAAPVTIEIGDTLALGLSRKEAIELSNRIVDAAEDAP